MFNFFKLWTVISRPLIYFFTAWTQPLYVTKSVFKSYFVLNSSRHKKAPKYDRYNRHPFQSIFCVVLCYFQLECCHYKTKVLSQVLQPLLDWLCNKSFYRPVMYASNFNLFVFWRQAGSMDIKGSYNRKHKGNNVFPYMIIILKLCIQISFNPLMNCHISAF